jgi:excisionase family DNA binding protein
MTTGQKNQMNTLARQADSLPRGALNMVEAAEYCGVRCSAIESVVRDGKLRGRRLGRNVIILKADLDAFLASLDVIAVHTPPSILKRRQEYSRGKVAA